MTSAEWKQEYEACLKRARRFELNREPAHATTQHLQARWAYDQMVKTAKAEPT